MLLLSCAIAAACLAATAALWFFTSGSHGAPAGVGSGPGAVSRMTLPVPVAESSVIYDTAVMPLAPEEASAINAQRPVDVTKVIPAKALLIAAESASGVGYAAALRCLTQAVYYEAASEPDEGQQAVAQVVLNRLRHPAFPNTVCGVVYQGSERVTGCQFSFTCDGSLARVPAMGAWLRAERAARDALAGKVAAAVGNATHYHANYVVPYWAPTLDKAATIGAHIFYIMRGFMGSPRAFRDRYDAALEAPPIPAITAADGLTVDQPGFLDSLGGQPGTMPDFEAPVEDMRAGNLIPGVPAASFGAQVPPALRADEQRGELKAGGTGALRADEREPAGAPPVGAPAPGEN